MSSLSTTEPSLGPGDSASNVSSSTVRRAKLNAEPDKAERRRQQQKASKRRCTLLRLSSLPASGTPSLTFTLRNGCPVFTATDANFANIDSFISSCLLLAADYGAFIVTPPPAAKKLLEDLANDRGPIDALRVATQHQTLTPKASYGSSKVVAHMTWAAAARPVSFASWHKRIETHLPAYTRDQLSDLEFEYWATLSHERIETDYAFISPGTIVPSSFSLHLQNLSGNLLTTISRQMVGINTPELFIGSRFATFAIHIEDQAVSAVNTLIYGAPKQWYIVRPSEAHAFRNIAHCHFPDEHLACREHLQHKKILISPAFARQMDINVMSPIQEMGESVFTIGTTYHWGFNYGVNVAEAWSYGDKVWWGKYQHTRLCECGLGSYVKISEDMFGTREN
jgi:hypothetical protein